MNLIIGNIDQLKSVVLPENLRDHSEWDDALSDLGKGVAAALQAYCNRKFERIVDDTFERSANCTYISLPRFPIESVSLVELKVDEQQGFSELPDNTALTINKEAGLIEFGSIIGSWTSRVRVTYTGGFWVNYDWPAEATLPSGATEMPADLIHAWHLQVQHEIEATNLLRGVAAKRTQDKAETRTGEIKLIERVKQMLKPFVRYS